MSVETEEGQEVQKTKGGFLNASLSRSNQQIRQERGDAIAEDLQIIYKRNVEDIEMKLTRLSREQKNAFDFSPTNSQSLVMAKELDSMQILEKDIQMSIRERELKITLNVAKQRYNFLFGETYKLEEII